MAAPGETIENPVTGERITWLRVGDDVLEWEDMWARPGHRAARHVHPRMEERWEVLEGRAAFRIGDDDPIEAAVGDIVVAPAGVAHEGWNPTDDPVRLRVTMTPPLGWASIVETLFAWARDGRTDDAGTPEIELLIGLLRDHPDELAPPG